MPGWPQLSDTVPLQAQNCLTQASLVLPLTPETLGFPLGQARRTQVLLATLSSSTGDVEEETSWVGYILANSAVPSGCCVQHWLCHGPPPLEVSQDNMGVAHPQQATPTLLFPSSSFHNTESN